MPTPAELEAKFWKALKSDRTMMVGLDGIEDAHPRPMTAQFERDGGPIWFFTAKDTELPRALLESDRAIATFADKNHDLFATLHGRLSVEPDRGTVDKFSNRFVAPWFEGGKDDPNLTLLRFKPERAEIWFDETSLLAGIKLLFGSDPKEPTRTRWCK